MEAQCLLANGRHRKEFGKQQAAFGERFEDRLFQRGEIFLRHGCDYTLDGSDWRTGILHGSQLGHFVSTSGDGFQVVFVGMCKRSIPARHAPMFLLSRPAFFMDLPDSA